MKNHVGAGSYALLMRVLLLAIGASAASWDPFQQPYFDNTTKREVTAAVGQTAYLHCRVRNLADRADGGVHRRMEGRVVTAPAAAGMGSAFTLRPLVMPANMQQVTWAQPSTVWPRQGIIWPPNQQQATQLSPQGTSQQVSGVQLGSSWPQGGRGGSWPGRRPPAPLRALSPPHAFTRWGSNNTSERSVQSQYTGDAEQSFWSPKHRNSLQATRLGEGLSSTTITKTPPSPLHHQRLSHYLNKDDEYDTSLKQSRSDGGSVNGELPSPAHLAPVSPARRSSISTKSSESKSNITVPIGSPRRLSVEASPRRFAQETPVPQIEFEDEVFQREIEERAPKSPSIDTSRFINDANQVKENTAEQEIESYKEERFINLKSRSPSEVIVDNKSLASDKLSVSSRISSESPIKSESSRGKPSPVKEPTPAATPIPVSPASSHLSVGIPAVDPEVESVGSVFSEVSLKESIKSSGGEEEVKSMGNGVSNVCGVSGDKISPIVKISRKGSKIIPKGLTGKPSGNKVKPDAAESTASLQAFEKPKEALTKCLSQLENPEWETVMTGIKTMERLVKNHPTLLETNLTPVARAVATQIKNLRSQVARSACRLSGEMFSTHKRTLEADAEELAVPLLNRTADTNKFLRSDANAALDVMCNSLSVHKTICLLMTRGSVHQNAVVRCTSARLLADVAGNFGFEKIFAMPKETRDKLFVTGSDLLTEGSSETRGHAKRLFKNLSQHQMFLRTLREVIPLSKYRNIEKALNNLRLQ